MNSLERPLVSTLVVLMVVLWLGFTWHSAPDFPGSPLGFFIGVVALLCMLVPLVYMIVKRVKPLKKVVTTHISMPTLLRIHIYAGVVGPILVLVHSAHRFDSLVGILLVIFMMVVVLSGFIGRYVLSLISSNIKEKKRQIQHLNEALAEAKMMLREAVCDVRYASFTQASSHASSLLGFHSPLSAQHERSRQEKRVLSIIETISDIEYSVFIHDTAKVWFSRWLRFHIVISVILYFMLLLHIVSEVYFGLRWL